MFFQSRFWDLLFLHFGVFFFFKNAWFWDPLRNPMGSKMAPKSTKWRQTSEKNVWRMLLWAVLFQTLFSPNHSNYCAVGTAWLLKGHFFYGDWLILCFCCVSLCSVLYNIFITFFQKTSVNAQPLSPPFFQEIAAHKEIYVFFSFLCFAFFQFFHISVDFRVPLADALGQIRSIFDWFWCHFWRLWRSPGRPLDGIGGVSDFIVF